MDNPIYATTYWTHLDGQTSFLYSCDDSYSSDAFIVEWQTTDTGTLIIPVDTSENAYQVNWGDGSVDNTIYTSTATHNYEDIGNYEVTILGQTPVLSTNFIDEEHNGQQIVDVKQWGTQVWKDMSYMFASNTALEISAFDTPNLSEVENMRFMFSNAIGFDSDLSQEL